MLIFELCPIPADLTHIICDFVFMVDKTKYQRCIHEAQHYIWYTTELCGQWCYDLRPSDYKALVKNRDPIEIRTRPLGYYQNAPYWELFLGLNL